MRRTTVVSLLTCLVATAWLAAPAAAAQAHRLTAPRPVLQPSPLPSITCNGYPARVLRFKTVPVDSPVPLPQLSLPRLDGGEPVTLAPKPGEVLLLYAWSLRMPGWRTLLGRLGAVQQDLKPRGVRLLGLCLDEDAAHARKHWEALVPGILCLQADRRAVMILGGFPQLPTTLVVGRDGLVAGTFWGLIEERQLSALLGAW
jgi:hypothetical protein